MKKVYLPNFTYVLLELLAVKKLKKMPASYIEITNKQQIDSITQTFIDREIYPFIYTRLKILMEL